MSDYDDFTEIAATDDLRIGLVLDTVSEEPDHDGQPFVFQVGPRRVELLHADYGQQLPDDIDDVIHEHADHIDDIERILRDRPDVVAVGYVSLPRHVSLIFVVTADLAESWGLDLSDPDLHDKIGLSAAIETWRAYLDGEIYGYVIEERVTWTRGDTGEKRETWETVDYCGGFYGYQYAKEAAREVWREVLDI